MHQRNKHVILSTIMVVLLALLVCFRFYGEILANPDHYLFGSDGDGLKNYYSVAYQAVWGDGDHFEGMLYPYGDHVTFSDGQPLLAKVFSKFYSGQPENGTRIIGWMNLSMILSLVLTAFFTHLLLLKANVQAYVSVVFALLISFLSPQVARMAGHYALAYSFFVPMVWYLLSQIQSSNTKWVWTVLGISSVLIFGFIQPYYMMIAAIFAGSVLCWNALIDQHLKQNLFRYLGIFLVGLAPIVLFSVYLSTSNTVIDRPCCPGGILEFVATIPSVFMPVQEPFRHLFHSYFFRFFNLGDWEGYSYVGMIPTITGIIFLPLLALRIWRKRWAIFTNPTLPNVLKLALVPSILCLLFAMGTFHKLGLLWLSDYVGPLKQFRSLGRLAWIFYFVFSVWSAHHIWTSIRALRIRSSKLRYHAIVILGACMFVWMLDATVNVKSTKKLMMKNWEANKSFSTKYADEWRNAGVNLDDYQAILALPFTLVGSEKIGMSKGRYAMVHGFRGSFASGLPLFGGLMSRTSQSVTEKSAQLVANPLLLKPILDDIDQIKRILIIWSYEDLPPYQYEWIKNSKIVFENSEYRLFSVSVDEVKNRFNQTRNEAVALADSRQSQSPKYYEVKSKVLENERFLDASVYEIAEDQALINKEFDTDQKLILSFWVKLDANVPLLPFVDVYQNHSENSVKRIYPRLHNNVLGGWLEVSDTLVASAGSYSWKVSGRTAKFSRIQLRNSGETLVHSEGERVFVNNIPAN